MALKTFDHFEQGTPAWKEARAGIVTASIIGGLITPTLKVAHNEASRGIVEALAIERLTGMVEDLPETRDMQRGTLSEPYARDAYAEDQGVKVREVGFFRRDMTNWKVGYSPDGVVGDDGLIECKAPRRKGHFRTILADEVPTHGYMAQCQTGLYVTGRSWIDFVSYNAGMPLYIKRVRLDEAWFLAIEEAVAQAEEQIAELTDAYLKAVEGRPETEYIDVFGEEGW